MTDLDIANREQQLEARIAAAKRELLEAETPIGRKVKGRKMQHLISRRSPEQCRRMEVALFGGEVG